MCPGETSKRDSGPASRLVLTDSRRPACKVGLSIIRSPALPLYLNPTPSKPARLARALWLLMIDGIGRAVGEGGGSGQAPRGQGLVHVFARADRHRIWAEIPALRRPYTEEAFSPLHNLPSAILYGVTKVDPAGREPATLLSHTLTPKDC
ncbi:hypothetical protein Bbelb_012880 [Branchiostoma belcheri]|nr:hypothetical protein Bbelb_012880 [Branchiostoma belcheri]